MKYHNITQSIVTVKTTQVEIRLFTNELNHALYEEDYNLACIVRDKIKEKEYSIEKVKSMLEKHLSELEFFDNDYIFERRFLTNFLMEDILEDHSIVNNGSLGFNDNYPSEKTHQRRKLERQKRSEWFRFLRIRRFRIENNLKKNNRLYEQEIDLIHESMFKDIKH